LRVEQLERLQFSGIFRFKLKVRFSPRGEATAVAGIENLPLLGSRDSYRRRHPLEVA
jgi:hypothetical protein